MAARAQRSLPGLAAHDLKLCAGVPDRIASLTAPDGTERHYWTYVRAPPSSLGLHMPLIGLSLSSTGDCRATFELVGGRVARLAYSGNPELGPARDAACIGVVQGCLDLLRTLPRALPPVPACQPDAAGPPPAISRISLRRTALPKTAKLSATITKAPGPPITF